jgi:hypothetical protein
MKRRMNYLSFDTKFTTDNVYIRYGNGSNIGAQTYNTYQYIGNDIRRKFDYY